MSVQVICNDFVCICMCVCIYNINQNKRTPLHMAAEGGHGKIVETLVEAKADLCALDDVSALKETGRMLLKGGKK